MKRMFASILAAAAILAFSGCQSSPASSENGSSTPASPSAPSESPSAGQELPELSVSIVAHPDDNTDVSLPWFAQVEKQWGGKIDWIFIPDENASEKTTAIIASGDLPDLLMSGLSTINLYGTDGIFEPLDALIDTYAPHFKAILTPEDLVSLRNADGNLYAIPRNTEVNAVTQGHITYRADILEAMGESEPTTMEGWTELFKKVQAAYPDLTVLSERASHVDRMAQMYTQFGMGTLYGSGAALYGLTAQGDRKTAEFLPITENYKAMLSWYAELYADGILDPGYLTIDYSVWWDQNMCGGKAFACTTQNFNRAYEATETAHNNGLNEVQWKVAETPENPITHEKVILMNTFPWDTGSAWALSADSQNKEAAMQFVDFWFSDEGSKLYNYGIEGENYREENGEIIRLPEGGMMDFVNHRTEVGYLFYVPTVISLKEAGYYSDPIMIDHFDKNKPHMESIPTLTSVSDDIDKMADSQTELATYVEQMRDKFITGRESLDNWDSFVQQCISLGCETNTGYIQGWLDDYYQKLG